VRFLDIAVASGYAAVCLSLVIVMNPVAPRESAVVAATQARLDSAIAAYVEHVGLPFLTTSSPPAICASAAEASNATLVLDVLVQGTNCGPSASRPAPLASSSLTLSLPGRVVVVSAWLVRR
jgi:hypothetical protein